MRILVVVGHPRAGSFSDALASEFVGGACQCGADVRIMYLRDMQFYPNVVIPPEGEQFCEPDLVRAREWLLWCEQVVFVFPTWWAGVPALLKGFLDRVLTSGFAFEETTGGTGYRGLLAPRSAWIFTTMDTPWFVYRWIYGRPGELAMKRGTLGFCGLSPVRAMTFSAVKESTPESRQRWLQQIHHAGRRAAMGPTWIERGWACLVVWLQAMRLQFYPMTFLAYTAGALGACGDLHSSLHWHTFGCGYCFLFFVEVATVFANDVFDLESDRQNQFYGPFSGGSRVLVENKVSRQTLVAGAIVASVLGMVAGLLALASAPKHDFSNVAMMVVLGVLAVGYTVPPLKLSHRGFGELDVCWTHSFGVILCGYMLQGGDWNAPFAWQLSVPLFLAIFPAILLAGIPDRKADQAAGKMTLVVRLGEKTTLVLSLVLVVLALVFALTWTQFELAQNAYDGLGWIAVPLGIWLLWRLFRATRRCEETRRMDGTIALALLFIFAFASVIVTNLLLKLV